MNNSSNLLEWEQHDPIAALCRRIAFAAMKGRDFSQSLEQFKPFLKVKVSKETIIAWLDNTPCVLLIDELNNLTEMGNAGSAAGQEMADFLKSEFLSRRNRYFVFSSHVISTVGKLMMFMDSNSNRAVMLHQLPLIPSLAAVNEAFNYHELTDRVALYCGKIPALIFEHKKGTPPNARRNGAIDEWINGGSDVRVISLLRTMFNGIDSDVPPGLLQFMDTAIEGETMLVKWIPMHMIGILTRIRQKSSLSHDLRGHIGKILNLFEKFKTAKTQSGEAWESLFVILLLVRVLTGTPDTLIPGFDELLDVCNVTYDAPFGSRHDVNSCTNVADFLECIPKTIDKMTTCVAIYVPSHSKFKTYDAFVVVWKKGKRNHIIGYQLKEGKNIPEHLSPNSVDDSFLIRGDPGQASSSKGCWQIASQGDIVKFFGVSGSDWTPARWKELSTESNTVVVQTRKRPHD